MAKTFRELEVWKKSVDLTVDIYDLTNSFPKHEIYGLTSQMRRAAVSVASNIAEGSARGTRKDFRQFIKQAEGSNCELQTQLVIARRLKFSSNDKWRKLKLFRSKSARCWVVWPPTSHAPFSLELPDWLNDN